MELHRLLPLKKYASVSINLAVSRANCLFLIAVITLLVRATCSFAQDAPAPLGDLITTVAGDSALTIQDTDYPYPADAIFVAPAPAGDDANTGSITAPVRTFPKALTLVPAGGTIVFREGVYRNFNDIRVQKKVTLQPYPHEKIWIKGSTVIPTEQWVGQTRNGMQVWHKANWTFEPKREDLRDPRAIDPAKPMSKYTDMVFIDGKPLQQVATLAEVRDAVETPTAWEPATFYVDSINDTLYIGRNPAGKTVEAATSERALFIDGPGRGTTGTTIRGLGFTHFAYEGLHSFAHQLVLEKNTFGWNAVYGFSFDGTTGTNIKDTYIQIRGNWVNYNGRKGFHANKANKLIVEGNVVAYNNTELFALWWDAGGMKIMRSENIRVLNNSAIGNKAIGIWLDINNYNAKVYNNYAQGNSSIGIFYEVGRWATIAGNISVGNGQGIQVSGSRNVTIFNNTTVDNITEIAVIDANRRPEPEGVQRAGSDWETRDVVIRNNLFSHGINTQDTRDKSFVNCWKDPVTDKIPMVTALDYNGYYRKYTAMPLNLWRISPWPTSYDAKFNTIADLRENTAFEDNGFLVDGQETNPFFISSTDYRLKEGSPAIGAGQLLPDSIAALLGWPERVPVNAGAYPGVALNKPTTLRATASSSVQVDLTWADHSAAESGYVIERSIGGNTSFAVIDSVSANATTYSSTGLTLNTIYYFRVRAYQPLGDRYSPNVKYYSNQASATTVLLPQTITFPPVGTRLTGDVFTVTAASDAHVPVAYRLVSGPATVTAAGEVTVTGEGLITLRAGNEGDVKYGPASAETTFTAVAPMPGVVKAINAGGAAYVSADGIRYSEEGTLVTGGSVFATASDVSGTTDDVPYQTKRYGTFSYAIPVPNGTYEITFGFAALTADSPIFDVTVEGQETISNLNIFTKAGFLARYDVVRTFTVTDGVINASFRAERGEAQLNALVVKQGVAGTGLMGTYYNNQDFSGNSESRVDATIDFDWGSTLPS